MLIQSIEKFSNGLQITWQDGEESSYDYFWLRDNARDPESFNANSYQREVYTAGIPRDITPQSVTVDDTGEQLLIQWPEVAIPSSYPAEFLYCYREPQSEYVYQQAQHWQQLNVDPRPLKFSDLIGSDGVEHLMQEVARLGFCLIQGCPRDQSAVKDVANKVGYVRQTIFGGVWEFEDNQEMADSAYTSDELRPHTDGTYSHDAPGLQLLLCVSREATGGDSVLVDGLQVAELLSNQHPELFSAMTRLNLTGVYKGDGHLLRASRPMFRRDEHSRIVQVSFNNYDRDTLRLPDAEMKLIYEGITAVDQMFNAPANQWRYGLAEGEMLVFDNWRVLHGRKSFIGHRRMAGAYVNREDFESKLRELRILEQSGT